MLDSQLAILEPLAPDAAGASVSGSGAPDDVVAEVLESLSRHQALSRQRGSRTGG
jgi:gluconate kinase